MKKESFLFLLAIVLLGGTGAEANPIVAETWVSNLTESATGTSGFTSTGWCTSSFITDGASYVLKSVTMRVLSQSVPVTIEALLYNNNGGQPGQIAETLIGNPTVNSIWDGSLDTTTFEDITVLSNGITLSPNTTYWLVATATSGAGVWASTNTTNSMSPGLWSITGEHSVSFDSGGIWSAGTPGYPNQFNIDAIIVPEPTTFLLFSLGMIMLRKRRN